MKKNIGKIDKIFRIILGIGLIAFAVTSGALWAWIGIVPLLTGLTDRCLLYRLTGFSSCKNKSLEK